MSGSPERSPRPLQHERSFMRFTLNTLADNLSGVVGSPQPDIDHCVLAESGEGENRQAFQVLSTKIWTATRGKELINGGLLSELGEEEAYDNFFEQYTLLTEPKGIWEELTSSASDDVIERFKDPDVPAKEKSKLWLSYGEPAVKIFTEKNRSRILENLLGSIRDGVDRIADKNPNSVFAGAKKLREAMLSRSDSPQNPKS